MSDATVTIIRTDSRVSNHATGETHPRHEVTVTCACPSCGDHDAHPGTSYRGTLRAVCGWCGHKWETAHAG